MGEVGQLSTEKLLVRLLLSRRKKCKRLSRLFPSTLLENHEDCELVVLNDMTDAAGVGVCKLLITRLDLLSFGASVNEGRDEVDIRRGFKGGVVP